MKSLLILLMVTLLFSCSKDSDGTSNASANGSGKGGSLARFTIVENNLYLVDDASLKIFNISDPANAELRNTIYLRFGVETIFRTKTNYSSVPGMECTSTLSLILMHPCC